METQRYQIDYNIMEYRRVSGFYPSEGFKPVMIYWETPKRPLGGFRYPTWYLEPFGGLEGELVPDMINVSQGVFSTRQIPMNALEHSAEEGTAQFE